MYIGKVKYGNNTWPVGSTLYGTCDTAAGTAAKVVTMPDFDTLLEGVTIHVKFTHSNGAHVGNATLNVNNTGAKTIMRYGTTAAGTGASASWNAGAVVSFTYDGTYWLMNDWVNTDTDTWRGITDSYNVTSPSDSTSLSQKGAKALYNALLNGYASSAGYASYLKGPDNRSTNNAPSWYMSNKGSTSLYGEFCQTGGANGNYEYRMTMTPWGDSSGQRPVQMAFNNSGAFLRTSSDDSNWNAWYQILTSGNSSVSLSGSTLTVKINGTTKSLTDTNTTYTFATGDSNGTFKVTPSGGTALNVSIKGLGDRAFDSTSYLPLSGGTLTNNSLHILNINNTGEESIDSGISFSKNGARKAWVGYNIAQGAYLFNSTRLKYLSYTDNGGLLFEGNNVWHAGNDGSGSGLDADLLDGYHASSFGRIYTHTMLSGKCVRITFGGQFAAIVSVRRTNGASGLTLVGNGYGENQTRNTWAQISPSSIFRWSVPATNSISTSIEISNTEGNNASIYVLQLTNVTVTFTDIDTLTTTGVDEPIANLNSNVASATKLQTARTLWGQNFDGTANVSGALSSVNSIYLNNNTAIYFKNTNGADLDVLRLSSGNTLHLGYSLSANGSPTNICGNEIRLLCGTPKKAGVILNSSGNVGIGITNPTKKLHVNGDILAGDISGNGSTNRLAFRHLDGQKFSDSDYNLYLQYNLSSYKTFFNGSTYYILGGQYNGNAASATQLANSRTIWGQNFNGTANVSGAMSNVSTIDLNGMANNANHGGIINFHYNGGSSVTSYIKEANDGRLDFHTSGGEGCGFVRIRNHGTGARILGVVLNSGQEWAFNIARVTVAGNPYTNSTVVFGQDGEPCVIQSSDTYNKSAFWVENASYNNKLKLYAKQNYSCIDAIDSSSDSINIIRYGGGQTSANDDLILGLYNRDVVIDNRNLRILCDEAEVMRVTKWGNCVGIGTTSPSYKLHVNGECAASSFPNTSDIRLKDIYSDWSPNIEDIAYAPSFLFKWKDGKDKNMHAGTSAQYWLSKAPELVTEAKDDIGTLSIQYDVLGTLSSITLAKEILELKKEIKRLQALIAEIKLLQK